MCRSGTSPRTSRSADLVERIELFSRSGMRNELAVLGPVASSPAAEQSGKTSLKPGRLDFGLLVAAATGGRPRHALRETCRWSDPTSPLPGGCVRIPERADMFGVDRRTPLRAWAQGIGVQ